MSIIEDTDYTPLLLSGEATLDECYDVWETIIRDSAKATNRPEYGSYLDNLKHYNKLLREFNVIKSMITILYYEVDDISIAYLRSKGYKINVTATTNKTEEYTKSLNDAMNRSNNLYTKIASRYGQIQKAMTESKGSNQKITFEVLMANLIAQLKVSVEDSITLARYNEYIKILEQQEKAIKAAKRKR